jgi:hypothetical protein
MVSHSESIVGLPIQTIIPGVTSALRRSLSFLPTCTNGDSPSPERNRSHNGEFALCHARPRSGKRSRSQYQLSSGDGCCAGTVCSPVLVELMRTTHGSDREKQTQARESGTRGKAIPLSIVVVQSGGFSAKRRRVSVWTSSFVDQSPVGTAMDCPLPNNIVPRSTRVRPVMTPSCGLQCP